MKIPSDILQVLDNDEIYKLTRFYGTPFYKVYLNKLKKKYSNLLYFIQDELSSDDGPDDIA